MDLILREFLKNAANVKPTRQQLNWYNTEFYAFIHFSPNTYTDREWGLGNEDPAVFNPTKLDCDQWVAAIKSAGMKGLVITAKHHDGFCLWPSKYTEHSVKNSPYKDGKGDIVREAMEACKRGGIKFGFYLSPWDRNSKYYGTSEYNDYFKAQLTELLTEYGDIFHVWFDNACGEGVNGKKQIYDFEGYIDLIRKYQPNATIFNDFGPDVRWCGNEAGQARYAEWAVVPKELTYRSMSQTDGAPMEGELSSMYNGDIDIGALSNIIYSKGLTFCGSEIDMSIRPGWFWHEKEEPHTLERLIKTYITSVGGNCCFNLNVPPNREGLIDERDVKRLKELGEALNNTFGINIAKDAKFENINIKSDTQCIIDIIFECEKEIRYIVLEEDISQGQRVESFIIQTENENKSYDKHYMGTCIGHKKICSVHIKTKKVRIFVTSARDKVIFKNIALY
ncbi:MAG: alpha-fucosidase [Clostridia bacterium]|nr:alpha-fucosidase [Clostridia bacterium]